MLDELAERSPATALPEKLEEPGELATLKGKARKLLALLVAGGPAFALYEQPRDRLDAIERRSRITQLVADEIEREGVVRPEFVERAKGRLLGGMLASQDNLEAVALAALKAVEAMAEPDRDAPADEPSPDWLQAFVREAEAASSETLRERLAWMLALEIWGPGTFSRKAVRFIADVDEEVLEEFALALRHRLGDAIVRDPEEWSQGEWFERGRALESEGLIAGHEGFTNRKVLLDGKGNGFFLGQAIGLVAQGTPNSSRAVSIWSLTRLGREVASLLPPTDEQASAVRLAKLMPKEHLARIAVGRWRASDEGRYTVTSPAVLWERR